MADYLYLYIKSLVDIQEIPGPFYSELLGKLYIQDNRLPELNDLLKHGILVDSATLAQYMIQHLNDPETLCFQTGIDILKRLGENSQVLHALVAHNKVIL